MVARIPHSPRACAITSVPYRVILHNTGIGKYCCRNINWIINVYIHTLCIYSHHFQVTALGVILHRGSYLRGFFNFIDFIVTVTSLIPILEFFTRGELESSGRYSYTYQSMQTSILYEGMHCGEHHHQVW